MQLFSFLFNLFIIFLINHFDYKMSNNGGFNFPQPKIQSVTLLSLE